MPAKTRVNITVDVETLRLADRLARARRISRSAVLRDGVHALAANEANELADQARRERQRRAAESMDRLAHKLGDWPAEELLRAARDRWQLSKKG
jgi:Arc/MetJ-type ribon-helix-helix transcriptional regulator